MKNKLNKKEKLLLGFILIFSVLVSFFSGWSKSITADEDNHITRGYALLETGDYRINVHHPPIANVVAAVPLKLFLDLEFDISDECWEIADHDCLAQKFIFEWNQNSYWQILHLSRAIHLVWMAGVLFLTFLLAKEIYGKKAGFFALLLSSTSANILAHGRTITTDMPAIFFFTLTIYLLIKNVKNLRGWKFTTFLGTILGLSMLTKYSLVLLIPIIAITYIFKLRNPKLWISRGFLLAAVMFLIMIAGYKVEFRTIESTIYDPAKIEELNQALEGQEFAKNLISEIKLPFAHWINGNFVNGFGYYSGTIREKYSYFNGEHSTEGFRLYFVTSFLLKNSLGFLFLLFLTVGSKLKERKLNEKEKILIGSIIFIYFIESIGKLNLGYRHAMIVDPLIFVFTSSIFLTKKYRKFFAGLVLLGAISVFSQTPDFTSYTNEILQPKDRWKAFRTSNLDWGQDDYYAKKEIEQISSNGELTIIYSYENSEWIEKEFHGLVFIAGNNLTGVDPESAKSSAFLRKLEPKKVFHGSYFIFEI